jgi:type II secretory pathway pseudopilin PulG
MRCRKRRALTLVELLLAVFVSVLTASAIVPIFLSAECSTRRAANLERATQSAHRELESWRQLGFSSLPRISTGNTTVRQTFTSDSNLPGVTGSLTITRVDGALTPSASETGLRKVEATISWSGSRYDRGSVRVTTLVGAPL